MYGHGNLTQVKVRYDGTFDTPIALCRRVGAALLTSQPKWVVCWMSSIDGVQVHLSSYSCARAQARFRLEFALWETSTILRVVSLGFIRSVADCPLINTRCWLNSFINGTAKGPIGATGEIRGQVSQALNVGPAPSFIPPSVVIHTSLAQTQLTVQSETEIFSAQLEVDGSWYSPVRSG